MLYKNKYVLITGASAGIGREFALQFHEQGANLILVARRSDVLSELKTVLEQIRADSIKIFVCDITKTKSVEYQEFINYIKSNQVDILINNAGRGSFGYFDQLKLEDEISLIDLNITATLPIAQAVIPQMKARKSGAIISLSSIAGFQPLPFMSTYAATKAFNLFHSLGLWYELKEFGVQVTIVCPGPVATEFGGVARVPGTISGGTRDSAQVVVRAALNDFKNKKLISIPGYKAKALISMVKILPRFLTTMFLGRKLKTVLELSKSR